MLDHKIFNTPIGELVVIENQDPTFPGITIEYQGETVAKIEVSKEDSELSAYTWKHGDDDIIHKVVSMVQPMKPRTDVIETTLKDDIVSVLYDEGYNLTEEQTNEIVTQVMKRFENEYGYEEYNEYLLDELIKITNRPFDATSKTNQTPKSNLDFKNLPGVYQDINHIVEEYGIIASEFDYIFVANKYFEEYDHSTYNEFIADLIREEKENLQN